MAILKKRTPYGLAKKMLLVQSQAYRQQYNMNAITLFPVNLYGPGDNFDLQSSHVFPLIRKYVRQCRGENNSLGTGVASREFLYVADAEGIVKATLDYEDADPVNLGSGTEISIRELAEMICEIVGSVEKSNGIKQTGWPTSPMPGHKPGKRLLRFRGED